MSLGESVSAGPFFKAYVANLLPGQFMQPFVDAAFSDLGLDPNVLLPSRRTDPQTGQPATPPLPLPYPRTGQGGPNRICPMITARYPGATAGQPGRSALPVSRAAARAAAGRSTPGRPRPRHRRGAPAGPCTVADIRACPRRTGIDARPPSTGAGR